MSYDKHVWFYAKLWPVLSGISTARSPVDITPWALSYVEIIPGSTPYYDFTKGNDIAKTSIHYDVTLSDVISICTYHYIILYNDIAMCLFYYILQWLIMMLLFLL